MKNVFLYGLCYVHIAVGIVVLLWPIKFVVVVAIIKYKILVMGFTKFWMRCPQLLFCFCCGVSG